MKVKKSILRFCDFRQLFSAKKVSKNIKSVQCNRNLLCRRASPGDICSIEDSGYHVSILIVPHQFQVMWSHHTDDLLVFDSSVQFAVMCPCMSVMGEDVGRGVITVLQSCIGHVITINFLAY